MPKKEQRQHMLLPVLFYIMIGMPGLVWAEIVGFELTIAQEMVSIAGASAEGMTLNGNIPGPTLRFKEGDIRQGSGKVDSLAVGNNDALSNLTGFIG